MLKVALTGNIASGKSFVEAVLSGYGYQVYDTDMIAHKILATSLDVREAFSNYDILNHKGQISREKLGKIIFAKPEMKKILEEIIHPQVKQELMKIFQFMQNEEIIFISIPLLFEAHFEEMFDKTIFVQADDTLRLERLMVRNDLTKEEAELRIKSQIPQEEKIKKVDFVIRNNSSVKEFEEEIKKVLEMLRQ